MDGLGEGLASLGFWIFVAALIVASIWDGVRKREAQHETLRRLMESGQPVDQALMDKLLGTGKHPDRAMRIAGIIALSAAPGLLIVAAVMMYVSWNASMFFLSLAGLVFCVGLGLLKASSVIGRWVEEDGGLREGR